MIAGVMFVIGLALALAGFRAHPREESKGVITGVGLGLMVWSLVIGTMVAVWP